MFLIWQSICLWQDQRSIYSNVFQKEFQKANINFFNYLFSNWDWTVKRNSAKWFKKKPTSYHLKGNGKFNEDVTEIFFSSFQ